MLACWRMWCNNGESRFVTGGGDRSGGKANDVALFECLISAPATRQSSPPRSAVEELDDDFAAIVERYSAALISFLFGMVGDQSKQRIWHKIR